MSSILLFTKAKTLGDANKVATSPHPGGGLRAQSRRLPKLGLWVIVIKVASSQPRGGGLRA